MRAGRGVWHTGSPVEGVSTRGFQLWLALPENLEHTPAQSNYLSAEEVPAIGPSRLILGAYEGASSPIPAPAAVNYLDLRLAEGEQWTYKPPPGHEIAWLAVSAGAVRVPELVPSGELVVFEENAAPIVIQALRAARFVLGSARKHPHALVTGRYSVHTTPAALRTGELEIQRIGAELAVAGKFIR